MVALAVLGLMTAGGASAQQIAPGGVEQQPGSHQALQFSVTQVGDTLFTTITFEGGFVGGGTHAIQVTAGATFSANSLLIIDSDAAGGGSGNIANEPSPDTTAFWNDGSTSVTVTFSKLMSDVSLFYSSSQPVSLQVFDAGAILLQTVNGAAQFNVSCSGDPNGPFCNWSPLSITRGSDEIASVTFSGVSNQTTFDDFKFGFSNPVANDDMAETIANQPVVIDVLFNDEVGDEPLVVTIEAKDVGNGPTNGTTSQTACTTKTNCDVTYTPDAGFGGIDTFEYTLTDVDGDSDTAIVTVTVDPSQAVVTAGTGVTVLLCADNPDCPNNPFNWFYPQVIDPGELLTECCAAPAVREVEGDGTGTFIFYNPRDLDIGQLIKTTSACSALLPLLPEIGDPEVEGYMPISVARPWLRAYPNPELIDNLTEGGADDPTETERFYNDFGALLELKWAICATKSTAVTNSITVMAEEPKNVDGIGFAVDGAENRIAFRPFTSGNSVDPEEGDFAFVVPWTAFLDKSGSGRRSSTNIALLTTRADPKQNSPKSMISRLGSDLRDEIVAEDGGDCLAPALIDDLLDLWKIAKNKIKKAKGDSTKILEPGGAVDAIDDLTVKALDFIPRCPDDRNANAVIAGRSMNWSYMTCSYLGHPEDEGPILLTDCPIAQSVKDAIDSPPPGLP